LGLSIRKMEAKEVQLLGGSKGNSEAESTYQKYALG
jgi:hypothetical protein